MYYSKNNIFSLIIENLNKKHYTKEEFDKFVKNLNLKSLSNSTLFYLLSALLKDKVDEVSTEMCIKYDSLTLINEKEILVKLPRKIDYFSDFKVIDENNIEIPYKICITSCNGVYNIDQYKNKDFIWISFLAPFSSCGVIIEKENLNKKEIYISYNAHILNLHKKEQVANEDTIVTSTNIYHRGFCYNN